MAVELATAYVSLVPSARGIATGMTKELAGPAAAAGRSAGAGASKSFAQSFSSGLSRAGKTASGLGDKLTLGITLPLGFAAKKVTDFASDLNESINATNVVFGGAAGIIDRFAKDSARSMGLSERAFREAVTPMGAMLQNLGFSQEAAADQSVQLSQRAADMASVFNTDVSTALDAINAGLRGESDPLEKFGVGLNEAAVQAEAVRLGLAKEGDELTSNQKAQARLSLIMGQTNKIAGDFANTSGESANAQRVAAAEAENAAAAFGQKLLPVKLKLIQAATRLMDWFNNLSKGQQDMALKAGLAVVALGPFLSITGRLTRGLSGVVKVGASFAKFTGGVVSGMRGVSAAAEGADKSMAKSFGTMIGNAARATARVVAAIVAQVARWVWLGVQSLIAAAKVAAAWLISLGPIGLVIAAVAGAAALIIKYWDEIQRFVTAAARAVVDYLKRNWPLILAILTGPVGLAVLAIIKHWDKIRDAFRAGVDFVVSIWQTAWNTVWSILQAAWRTISGFFTELPGRIKSYFVAAASWLIEGGRNILSGLWAGIKEIWNREVAFFTKLGSTIAGYFRNAVDWLKQGGKNIIRGLWSGIRQIWKDVVNWFKDLPGKVLSALGISSPPKWAIEAGRWILKGITKGLGLGVGKVMDFMGNLVGKFSAPLRAAWDDVFGATKEFLIGGPSGYAGLAEPFASAIRALINASGGLITIGSGRRSRAEQEALYAAYLARGKAPPVVARPGTSKHERGLAADLRGPYGLMHRLAKSFGIIFPVRGEPWHAQLGPGRSYYAQGTWRTRDEWARLHADEMVIPAGLASALRALPGGPGGTGGGIGGPLIGTVNIYANDRPGGRAAGRGFEDYLTRRRITTDARIA